MKQFNFNSTISYEKALENNMCNILTCLNNTAICLFELVYMRVEHFTVA